MKFGSADIRRRTRRRRRAREGAARDAWAALDAQQRELLADVGHDLKSPLSIVLALCSRLAESERLGEQEAADVARIRANAYTMLRRVQDLMLISRLQCPEVPFAPAVIDLAALVRGCAEGFRSVAQQRGVRLVIEAPGEAPTVADDEKLISAVSNLVANAIRYAGPGGLVRCSLATEDEELRIEVADDGPGVPPDQREGIFERYRRGRAAAGTGLGLAIVREIAGVHGGATWAGEAPEGGALFTLALPRTRAAGVAVRSLRSLSIDDRQRAIVEDLRAQLAL